MATSSLTPEDLAYYAQQQANVLNTQAIGQQEDSNAQSGADLTYQQKLQALQENLSQEQNALPDKFAARGVQNSGIFNYGGNNTAYTGSAEGGGFTTMPGVPGGQLGAKQQFGADSVTSTNDLLNQQQNVDQGYGLKLGDLNNAANDQLQTINTTEASQNASQAAADAISSGG